MKYEIAQVMVRAFIMHVQLCVFHYYVKSFYFKVQHSQKINETPISCWIIVEETGEICCAHCNCMAGLGETCTHIAAVLFYVEAVVRMQGARACTQSQCAWVIPSYMKSIDYVPIRKIDFTSASGKKRKLDEMLDESVDKNDSAEPSSDSCLNHCEQPTEEELSLLFEAISLAGTRPATLSIVDPYSDNYVPKSSQSVFPKPLKSLYDISYMQLKYHELLEVCESVSLSLEFTERMSQLVEKETRSQAKSSLWFKYRGRVTASYMKSVCHTDSANPAQSLIKSICFPEEFAFTSKPTSWGLKQENIARELYLKHIAPNHDCFVVSNSGLVINQEWPFLGASPDGIVECNCCGKGVLEIKCPYSHHSESILSAVISDKQFCLTKSDDGLLYLDHGHAYYYQVQTQMFICNVEYCDFCVFTFPAEREDSLPHIERIFRDGDFLEMCLEKARCFFRTCLLPEILGHWYTRPLVKSSSTSGSSASQSVDNSQY